MLYKDLQTVQMPYTKEGYGFEWIHELSGKGIIETTRELGKDSSFASNHWRNKHAA